MGGRSQFSRLCPNKMKATVGGVFGLVLPNFGQASVIAEAALDQEADKYSIVYNRFVSAMSQIPSRVDVLSGSALAGLENSPLEHYELEKAKEEFNGNLAEFNLATAIFAGMVDNQCSEMPPRWLLWTTLPVTVTVLEKFQIQYNKARQAKITTE